MGSTCWAELYFRSLKSNKVLLLLTKYLIRHKRVCIPHVGTFEIVQQSPQLNVVDKLIIPPAFKARYIEQDAVPEHQFDFFASSKEEKEKIRQELFSFGEKLRNQINQSSFYWNGFGTLRYKSNRVIFEPEVIPLSSFQPVVAEKVLRENVQHNVLVGDQEMTSSQVNEALSKQEYKRPWFIIAGWIIFIVAVLAIIIFLYLKNFQTASTGMQSHF